MPLYYSLVCYLGKPLYNIDEVYSSQPQVSLVERELLRRRIDKFLDYNAKAGTITKKLRSLNELTEFSNLDDEEVT